MKESNRIQPASHIGKVGNNMREINKKVKPRMSDQSKESFREVNKSGPMSKRGCTDSLCFLIFFAFVVLHIGSAGYGISKGNPWELARPYDLDGNPCGAKSTNTEDYPYAYFYNFISGFDRVMCIKNCPTWTATGTVPISLGHCYLGTINSVELGKTGDPLLPNTICDKVYLVNLDSTDSAINDAFTSHVKSHITGSAQPAFLYNTTKFMDNYCIPALQIDASAEASAKYKRFMSGTAGSDIAEDYFSDLGNSWVIIICSAGAAFVFSLIYMIVLRFCVGVLIWFTILLFLIAQLLLCIFLHYKSNDYKKKYEATGAEIYSSSSNKYWYCALAMDAITFTSLCVICCFLRTIELCIAVLKSAAIFVRQNFCVVFIPVINAAIVILYFLAWAICLLYLWSIGTYEKRPGYPIGKVTWDGLNRSLVYAFMFGLLWIGSYILYIGQFSIIAAACIWYYNHSEDKSMHRSPIGSGIWWAFRYHTGSIAFAAFILSVVIAMKLILTYIQWQVEKMTTKNAQNSCLMRSLFASLQCILTCAYRLIKVINKSGFITVVLKSQNFCISCLEGFTLLLRNPMKFGMISIFGEIFVFMGKVFVATLTAVLGYYIVTNYEPYTLTLHTAFVPTVFFFINGLVVGSIFMSVYGLSADTIMFCFILEKDMGGPSEGRNCPGPIKEFFTKYKTDTPESDEQ